MKIRLLSIGTRMPAWVVQGFESYAKRLPRENQLVLEEIPRPAHDGDLARSIELEGQRMLAKIKATDWVVALDERGAAWDSAMLAAQLQHWRQQGRDTVLLVGGPSGLAPAALARADSRWSLSALTLPHALVRVLVAEQIYRAWTLLHNHPYHRA